MQSDILSTQSLVRKFGELTAVDQVSFSVAEGQIFGLVGLNGAGKSTLIKMLITLLAPTAGTAQVCGFDLMRGAASIRRAIGYVPQLVSADGDLTGYENLNLYAKLYDVPSDNRRYRIREALAFMDLEAVGERLVKTYSGGMVRRLEIAQSMLHRPQLLFLDEPTVGLDPVARSSVWRHIMNLRKEFGTTIFLTTHLLEEVEELCTDMAIMTDGKMVACGTPAELKATVGPAATLEETFVHYSKVSREAAAGYAEAQLARRTARRLG
ncbi:MAG TPA: ATP-binding cassette domain-containing protein [Fimbriimonas sp.]|nr:ATP-binding cassette domain-containing protein [Fimbriimonas sp.]